MRETEETTLVDLLLSQPEIVAWLGADELQHDEEDSSSAGGDV